MRHKIIFVSAALLILSLMLVNPLSDLMSRNRSADTAALATKNSIAAALSQLPILFIQNQGQLDKAVEYYVKAPAQTLYFTKEGITFDVTRHNQVEATGIANRQAERLVFSLDFLGANNKPSIESTGKDNAVVNYFIGNDPEKWHSDIPTYREVVYHDIYPSIDLRLLGKGNVLEYDFVVRPGASPDDIALAYNGIDSLKIQNGQLAIGTAFGDIKQDRPYIYQQIGDETVKVAGGFSLGNGNTYGFDVPAYDERYPLVIDPTLAYSTYLGGSEPDRAYGIAVDSAGCAYVTGFTFSTDFPTQNAYQGTNAGSDDAFVTKLSAAGNSLIYSTYLGGSGDDEGYGIAVDSSGCAYVTGYTRSTDFPTQNAYQGTNAGSYDAFVAKLSAAGNSLSYSTYLGGSGDDGGYGIAVDSAGCAYVTGYTYSTDFPTTPGAFQGTYAGNSDAFVAKLSAAGNSLSYSTYLGGSGDDGGYGIAVDSSGCAYVNGYTRSTDFPTQNAYQGTNAGSDDAFVAKLSAAGNSLSYSTYLGGSDNDGGYGIAVDSSGCAYVNGFTGSTDFPTQNAYQGTNAGSEDAFVAKLSAAGNSLIYSTYLGGSDYDDGYGIAVDSAGCAYVNGYTRSTDFPTQNAYQGTNAGNNDAFVTKLCSSTQPTVTTSAATGISTSSALNMSYTLGGYSSVDVRFAYKVSTASSWTYTLWVSKSAAGTYAETVTGLLPGIQYDFKAQLKYNSTVIEGDTLQFTTIMLPAQPRVSPSLPRQLNQAQLSLQYLNVSPQQASANQPVTISTNVVNTGDEAGSLNVALKINGQVEQTRMVSVGAQATQPVKFTVTRSQPGTYTVDILDQNGSFNVLGAGGTGGKPVNSGMVIFVALAVLALTVVVVLMMTFRRSA